MPRTFVYPLPHPFTLIASPPPPPRSPPCPCVSTQFFKQMDTDGGGTVDFGEFAIGMTNCPGGKEADGVLRLQEAFLKYVPI